MDSKLVILLTGTAVLGAALLLGKKSTAEETEGLVSGNIYDDYGPIEGVAVTIGSIIVYTDIFGNYGVSVPAGQYALSAQKDGYEEVTTVVNIVAGENTFNLNMTLLLGTLSGYVVDALTNNPIEGVAVSLEGTTIYTGLDGFYIIEDIVPGEYQITFSKDGYETVTI